MKRHSHELVTGILHSRLSAGAAGLAAIVAVCGFLAACSSSSGSPGAGDAAPSEAGQGDTGSGDAGGGTGLTCSDLLSCDEPCSSSTCTNACYAKSTAHAQGLFNGLTTCIADQCPSTDGGACANGSSMQCSQCDTMAATTACVTFLSACEDDTQAGPADPDGGAQVIDSGVVDAGPRVSCGMIVACDQSCAPGNTACQTKCAAEGTATAQALDMALANCVAQACPTTGPCADAGTACTGCQEQSYYGACVTPFTACQNDRSAMPDGGTEPVALQGGTISVLASGLDQPQVVLIQNGDAFFSEITSTGAVKKVPVDGGAATVISASQPYPMGLAIDANNIYVWNSGSFSGMTALNNSDGTVIQLPLSGGSAVTLATGMVVAFDAPYVNAIAHDTSSVYWVSGGPGTAGAINAAPIGGGSAARVLYPNQEFPEAIATDGTSLYWSNWGTFDAQGNYNNDGSILKAPIAGGTPATLASHQSAPAALAVDSNNVYWTNTGKLTPGGLATPSTGSVMKVPIAGGTPVVLAPNQNIAVGIALSSTTVYWAEFGFSVPGNIKSVPVGGGTTTTLVTNATDPFGIAVSAGAVYWTKNIPTGTGDGTLYKLTP